MQNECVARSALIVTISARCCGQEGDTLSRLECGCVVVLVCAALAWPCSAGDLINGDFEDGFAGWTVEGEVSIGSTGDNSYALFQENPLGGVSRIFQVYNVQASPGTVSFRYTMTWLDYPLEPAEGDGEPTGTCGWIFEDDLEHYFPQNDGHGRDWLPPAPPDSFSVFILDPDTLERLIPAQGDPPDVFQYCFYADTTGIVDFNPDYVTVSPPDTDGATVVTLDVSSLAPERSVRLEFGLAGFADGTMTFVGLDNISREAGVPPDPHSVPAVSELGQVIMALLLLGGGILAFGRRRRAEGRRA